MQCDAVRCNVTCGAVQFYNFVGGFGVVLRFVRFIRFDEQPKLQFRQFDLNIPLSSRFYSYIVTKQMNSNEYYIIVFCITCNTYPYSYLINIIVD